jgi:aspartyl-tRNA(Asn)/glutamyl-tRNA(Gln) amidotransferase subunit A
MSLCDLSIREINKGLKEKDYSAKELVNCFFDKIEEKDSKIFSYLNTEKEKTLKNAQRVDGLIEKGEEVSLLTGVPFAVKDNILVKGMNCTAGSKILENYIAPYNATVVKRLLEENSLILGKTNLDEFAMGSSTEYSAFGVTHNPQDLERVPGGSSGGSAASVAAGLASFALGSDTGGSIRQPASFCGVVGLKPTYGSVSRYGLIAMASSLDQIGVLAKNSDDVDIVFDAIKGKDEKDSTSVELEAGEKEFNIKGATIGVPKEYFLEGIDPEVENKVKESIEKMKQEGVNFKEVSLPHCTDYALATYYIIMPSEASSNLSRYDGIKYGFSDQEVDDLKEVYSSSREKGFGKEVIRRVMLGTYSLSSGYYDAYYLRAQKVRTLIREDFEKAFKEVDFIVTPTTPTVAFNIGEKVSDPLSMYLSDILVAAVNLAGLPAISLPCGKKDMLPVGIQFIGKAFEEKSLLKLGKFFEKINK